MEGVSAVKRVGGKTLKGPAEEKQRLVHKVEADKEGQSCLTRAHCYNYICPFALPSPSSSGPRGPPALSELSDQMPSVI